MKNYLNCGNCLHLFENQISDNIVEISCTLATPITGVNDYCKKHILFEKKYNDIPGKIFKIKNDDELPAIGAIGIFLITTTIIGVLMIGAVFAWLANL